MIKKKLSDVDLSALRGRTVVVRADLNVPVDDGEIGDDQRIRASLPTLRALTEAGARVVLLSHLGRPKGVPAPELSLEPVARRLSDLLARPVSFVPHTEGRRAAGLIANLPEGVIGLLENTRFHPGETRNDPELARSWYKYFRSLGWTTAPSLGRRVWTLKFTMPFPYSNFYKL